ncbi:MAG: glycolate oxidase subunit GlcF [Alphaproteobacteria bacterium]
METRFSTTQLADPALAFADNILRRCVHCGLCTATCPTYMLLGDERDSPRGRIILIRDMLEKGSKPTVEVRTHIDRCLSCMACMTTCPSSVDYMHLVDMARIHIEKSTRRSQKEHVLRLMLRKILPYPSRLRTAFKLAWLAQPFKWLFRGLGLPEVAAMLKLAALPRAKPKPSPGKTIFPALGSERRARVILLAGCAQSVLRPQINEAAIRLLTSQGVEVVIPEEAGCCGSLSNHQGQEEEALAFARNNIDTWERVTETDPVDAIITTTSGCGTTMKDYGYMLAGEAAYAERARNISALVMDITEFLTHKISLGAPMGWSDIRVAYHAACSLEHAQCVCNEPRDLLRDSGFSVVEIPEGHTCCGSAGTYNVMQPVLADELRDRKLANIAAANADVVASGNIGCIQQLTAPDALPVVHTVELLNWAYGGACPAELSHLSESIRVMRTEFGGRTLARVAE